MTTIISVLWYGYLIGAILMLIGLLWATKRWRDDILSFIGWFGNESIIYIVCIFGAVAWPVFVFRYFVRHAR